MYNAQKAEDVGESECFYVMKEIRVQTLPYGQNITTLREQKERSVL